MSAMYASTPTRCNLLDFSSTEARCVSMNSTIFSKRSERPESRQTHYYNSLTPRNAATLKRHACAPIDYAPAGVAVHPLSPPEPPLTQPPFFPQTRIISQSLKLTREGCVSREGECAPGAAPNIRTSSRPAFMAFPATLRRKYRAS